MRIICFVNDELCVIAGLVTKTRDEGEKYIITLQYTEGNPKCFETVETDVVFMDRPPQDGGPPRPYAKWAREKGVSAGDRLIVFTRFTGSNHKTAVGYACKINGIITVGAAEGRPEQNVISGLVDSVRIVPGKPKGWDCIALGMYMGLDRSGNPRRTDIYVNRHGLRNLCMRDLKPRPDGTKMYAAFLCGPEHPYTSRTGVLKKSYAGIDFTVMGEKRREKDS